MAPRWTKFLYAPINPNSQEIRLIILKPPREPGDVIRCSLIRESLARDIQFEALSYQWGEEYDDREINIDGWRVPVRKNLWDALCHLRSTRDRSLWIDALCINQFNVRERNHQVGQMSQIYGKSWRVLIWLGLKGEDSHLALDFITIVGEDSQAVYRDLATFTGFGRELQAVRRLCQRSYWHRLWIIQEVIMARKARIQCGLDYASWDDFDRFQYAFEQGRILTPQDDDFKDLKDSLPFKLDRHQVARPKLKDILVEYCTSQCSDPRDKIYGLVGLANDSNALKIDYSKSFFQIYKDIVLLQQYEDCALLVSFSLFLQRLLGGRVKRLIPKDAHMSQEFAGAIGYETGYIMQLGPFYADSLVPSSPGSSRSSFAKFLSEAGTDGQHQIDALRSPKLQQQVADTVIAIHSHASYALERGEEFEVYRSRLREFENVDGHHTKAEPWGQLTIAVEPMRQRIAKQTAKEYEKSEPRFFLDDAGHVGLVPSNARVSDIICRFRDCDVIAIVRWSRDRYVMVGRAVLAKRRFGEKKRLYKGSMESFQFSVPTEEELRRNTSFYLNAYTLQLMTE
jgi:hypothetical protein